MAYYSYEIELMRHSESEIIEKAFDQLGRDRSLIMHRDQTVQEIFFIEKNDTDVIQFHKHTYLVKFVKSETYPHVWDFDEIIDWRISPMINK